MTAERTPQSDQHLLSRPLRWLTGKVLRTPRLTLLFAALSVAASVWYTSDHLGFRTGRLHLLNPESSFNQLWLEYIEEFGDEDDVVIVVRASSAEEVIPAVEQIADRLALEPDLFVNSLHKVDLSGLQGKGLHYLSQEQLQLVKQFLARVEPVLHNDWSQLNLVHLLASLGHQMEAARASGQPIPHDDLARLIQGLSGAFGPQEHYLSPLPAPVVMPQPLGGDRPEYLLADDGRLGVILFHLAAADPTNQQAEGFAPGTAAIDRLRTLLDDQLEMLPAGVEVGLTGLPVMENDEMRASQETMTLASGLSLAGVSLLFWASFGGWRHMLLCVVALVVGMAWAFAFLTAAVGHLNILSVSFAVILIGLGIDFSIHYTARYLQLRSGATTGPDGNASQEQTSVQAERNGQLAQGPGRVGYGRDAALLGTAVSVGPGIVTGVLTTAVAFYTASFTEFTGIAELGLIAGGGIVLCGLASLVVLPALFRLSDPVRNDRPFPVPLQYGWWMAPVLGRPVLVLLCGLLVTAGSAFGLRHLWYDYNLLNLQPEGLESVVWEKRLLTDSGQSVWYALSLADTPAELLELERRFQQLPSVDRTDQVASLVAVDAGEKVPLIEDIHQRVVGLVDRPPVIPVNSPQQVDAWLGALQHTLGQMPGKEALAEACGQLRGQVLGHSLYEFYGRCGRFQQQLAAEVWGRLDQLRQTSDPKLPSLDDLPQGLVSRFVGKQGRYLLKIYAKGDIWDVDQLESFVSDVRSVDPYATGKPLQTYEAARQMKSSYQHAALYALAAIVILLWADFRSLREVLLALCPLCLAMLQLFGLMGLLGIPINPANIIVLPLIMGIGVDDGVHIVHDFRRQGGRYRLSDSTANGVLLTSLTTMVGFGSLMIADHRGIESLGRVMVLGSFTCWLNSLFVLPALLGLISRVRRPNQPAGDATPHPDSAPAEGPRQSSSLPSRMAA